MLVHEASQVDIIAITLGARDQEQRIVPSVCATYSYHPGEK